MAEKADIFIGNCRLTVDQISKIRAHTSGDYCNEIDLTVDASVNVSVQLMNAHARRRSSITECDYSQSAMCLLIDFYSGSRQRFACQVWTFSARQIQDFHKATARVSVSHPVIHPPCSPHLPHRYKLHIYSKSWNTSSKSVLIRYVIYYLLGKKTLSVASVRSSVRPSRTHSE